MGVPCVIPGTSAGQGRGWKYWLIGAVEVLNALFVLPRVKGSSASEGEGGSLELLATGARYVDMSCGPQDRLSDQIWYMYRIPVIDAFLFILVRVTEAICALTLRLHVS